MNSGILLDTHALVWLAFADARLGPRARSLIDATLKDDAVFVSAISFFEVATLSRRGRLRLYEGAATWRRAVLQRGITEAPLVGEVAIAAADLDGLPGDPADRIITATAIVRDATLVTADERILGWSGNVRRQDARL